MSSQSVASGSKGAKTLDDAPLNGLHILAAVCTLGGTALDGYILGVVGTAVEPAAKELHLDALGKGLIAASALIGVFIGGLLFGRIADKYGRRRVFQWNLIAFVVLSALQLVTIGQWDLVGYRVALGIAVGVEYAVGTALLAEFAPKRLRSLLLGGLQAAWIFGFVAAFIFGHFYTGENWRMFLATSAIPALVILILRSRLPESPRWLVSQGRNEEARAVVDKHWGKEFDIPEVTDLNEGHASMKELFTKDVWRRTVYAGLFWACQVAPLFAIFTFISPILKDLGIESGFAGDLLMNGLQLAGAIIFVYILQVMTRRGFVIWTFAIQLGTLLLVGVWADAPLLVVTAALGIFVFVIAGASNIQFVYPSEMFETRIRSTGVGFAAAMSRIGAAISTYLLPLALDQFGAGTTLLIAAIFPLIGLIASIFWAPETKHISLF